MKHRPYHATTRPTTPSSVIAANWERNTWVYDAKVLDKCNPHQHPLSIIYFCLRKKGLKNLECLKKFCGQSRTGQNMPGDDEEVGKQAGTSVLRLWIPGYMQWGRQEISYKSRVSKKLWTYDESVYYRHDDEKVLTDCEVVDINNMGARREGRESAGETEKFCNRPPWFVDLNG